MSVTANISAEAYGVGGMYLESVVFGDRDVLFGGMTKIETSNVAVRPCGMAVVNQAEIL